MRRIIVTANGPPVFRRVNRLRTRAPHFRDRSCSHATHVVRCEREPYRACSRGESRAREFEMMCRTSTPQSSTVSAGCSREHTLWCGRWRTVRTRAVYFPIFRVYSRLRVSRFRQSTIMVVCAGTPCAAVQLYESRTRRHDLFAGPTRSSLVLEPATIETCAQLVRR